MKKYAIVGASSRGMGLFAIHISKQYADVAKLVGVYDSNHKRAQLLQQKCGESMDERGA